MKRDLTDRADVAAVVHGFYAKVRNDDILGPVFNSIITNWESHLDTLTDFWAMTLFGGKGYRGNPIDVHQKVDDRSGNSIGALHFGTWINLWLATLDGLFSGPNADLLKRRARKMQTPILVAIYDNRRRT